MSSGLRIGPCARNVSPFLRRRGRAYLKSLCDLRKTECRDERESQKVQRVRNQLECGDDGLEFNVDNVVDDYPAARMSAERDCVGGAEARTMHPMRRRRL